MANNPELFNLPSGNPSTAYDSSESGGSPYLDSAAQMALLSSQLPIRSGMTGYIQGNAGYFLGFAKGISGIKNGTPVFSVGTPGGAVFSFNGMNLQMSGGTLIIDSTGSPGAVVYGAQFGTCTDGNAVTFPQAYSQPPLVMLGSGGVTFDTVLGTAANQWQTFQAQNLTKTGFTPYLKIQSGGSQVAQSVNFGSLPATSTTATLNTTVAYDNNYTYNYTIQIGGGNQYTETITLSYSANGNSPFTTVSTFQKTNLTNSTKTWTFSSLFNISGLIANTSKLQIQITNNSGSSQVNTGATATYTSGTPTTVHSATPTGVSPISWAAFGITV